MLDSLTFGNKYQLNAQVNLPLYILMENNGDKIITTSDSVRVEVLLNGKTYGTITTTPKKDWEIDSTLLLGATLPLYLAPEYINLSDNLDNVLCSHISAIIFAEDGMSAIDDEGFCGSFQINVQNEVEETEINNIAVYPNPVRDLLNIENANNINVTIYSANGQMVKNLSNVNGNITVNTSELSNGLYFVKMQNANATRIEKIQVIR